MELYFKLFEVLSPVFFIVGIGYFLGKKKSDIDTTFITNYSANFGAPALFILLARRFGQLVTDPIAMKAWNDALNPDQQIKLLMGKKVGDGVPGLLGIGRRYFKGIRK